MLLSIGTRGDAQPLVALALQLRALGQEVHLCVSPDFRDWIEGLGFSEGGVGPPSPPRERVRELLQASVAAQFETIAQAAEGCDAIVAATAVQIAARSLAEARDPVRLRGVLPRRPAVAAPRALAHAVSTARARGRAQPGVVGPRCGRLQRHVPRGSERSPRIARPGGGRRRAQSRLRRGSMAGRRSDIAPWPDPERPVFQPGAWIVPCPECCRGDSTAAAGRWLPPWVPANSRRKTTPGSDSSGSATPSAVQDRDRRRSLLSCNEENRVCTSVTRAIS